MKKQENYWINKFEGEIPVLNLPMDYARPLVRSNEGATVYFWLSQSETDQLKLMAEANGLTIYMSILSVFTILLSKLSGQEDIIIGTLIAGHSRGDLKSEAGTFVNTLAMRNEVNGSDTLKEYISKLKQNTLESFEHQDYQFEDLLDKLSVERDASRNPVFDVMFNMLNQDNCESDLSSFNNNELIHNLGISKFDLTLTAVDYGDQLMLSFEYCTKLFKPEFIERLIRYFKQLAQQLPVSLDEKLYTFEILSDEEKQELLYGFNETKTNYPSDKTIHQLFEDQVSKNPDRILVSSGDVCISYKELNNRGNQLAWHLKELGVDIGDVVGLNTERTEELIIGIVGILKCGAAYLPLNSDWPNERINFMLSDSCCTILIHGGTVVDSKEIICDLVDISNQDLYKGSKENLDLAIKSSNRIYIIYTSGTTGNPKGVLTTHMNVSRVVLDTEYISINSRDNILQLSSYTFDGSVFDIYGALLNGSGLVMINNDDLLDISLLLDIISKKQISIFFLTTALFNTIVDYGMSKLKAVRKILFGGERISVQHTQKALEELGEGRLVHVYGPTETTVFASYHNINAIDKERETIPIGTPISNTSIYLFDAREQLVPKGVTGEIYIGGCGNAKGYLNNPELTNNKFVTNPYNKEDILYKTGDLARFLPDGNIEFLGRIDHQVKIRGFRIELGEIENVLLKHDSIRECVVIDREENGDKYLCAYLVKEEEIEQEEIRNYLSGHLPQYMVPSYFVELDKMPLTVNGKVNRKVLPSPEIKAGDDYVAPSNATEEKLVEIWSEVLKIEKEEISTTVNFFSIGGHSLKASALAGRIHKETGIEFPLRYIFIHSCIQAQAGQIEKSTKKDFVSIPKAKNQEYYSLSSAQKRMYFLQQMDLESTVYNIPYYLPLGIEVNKQQVQETINLLIKRHESFRTSFHIKEDTAVQKIHEELSINIEEYKIKEDEKDELLERFTRAFDLSSAPLLRIALVEVQSSGLYLLIDIHHIISDGVSVEVLEQELFSLFSEKKLPELSLQYKDFSEWQNSEEQQEKNKEQEAYWINKYEGDLPVLNLPIDYVRPVMQSFEGATVSFVLSKEDTEKIKILTKENGLTLYMTILSVFTIFLSKLTGQEDIIVGTPVAGRSHVDLEHIIGMFVNTLAMRYEVQGSSTVKEYIGKSKQNTLESFEYQDYQFEDLVEQVSAERDASRNPIFDVMFNMLNQKDYEGDLSTFNNNELIHTLGISKFDLTLTALDYGDQILFNLAYCTQLFKPESIERYVGYFKKIINQLPESLDKELSSLEILSSEEKQQLLHEFNNTTSDYPREKTIHQLFEEQVVSTPKSIALVYKNTELTYQELNQRSNQLSHILVSKGLKPDNIVSIMLDRSIEMIVGILSVLKAGGAYCPIDINNPVERKKYILKDSKSGILLTRSKLLGDLDYEGEIVYADEFGILPNSDDSPGVIITPKNLAYIIYTSGTTGNPKGVMIRHDGVVNTISWYAQRYKLIPGERLLQLSNYSFDASVNQIFGTLTAGASLYIIEDSVLLDLSSLYLYLGTHKITVINSVPAILEELISNRQRLPFLQRIISGGESLSNQLKDKIINLGYELHNHYGPTEGTIVVLAEECSEKDVSLGKPKQNTQSYILSRSYDQLQPIGVKGELCISGEGISPGYINNEALTKEKFIANPFKKGERLYKTGDLACWLPDGNIEFLGRIDHQVKIRGFRIELGEIENVLQKHENIKEIIVLAREENGDKYLCAYLVAKEDFNEEEIRTYLSSSLPGYMIPSYFVQLEKLPLTSNGKVNRKALPSPEIKAGNDYVAPSNEIEEKLVEIWSEILKIEKEEISTTANFFSIGGHSLKASVLTGRIYKETGVEFPLRDVFIHTRIQAQASQIEKSTKKDFISIPKAKKQEYYSLSSAQKRMYFLQQMDLESTVYNMPYYLPLGIEINKQQVQEAINLLIKRHESFRTSFHMKEDTLVQQIHEVLSINVEEYKIKEDEKGELLERLTRVFDLSSAPLLRIAHVEVKGSELYLLIDMHHIISDGISLKVFEQEFFSLISGNKLPELSLQYKDFSEWQNSEEQQEKNKEQEAYWINKFEGELPILDLPIDYVRPVMQSFEGATVSFMLSKEDTGKIKILTKENGLTLYMSILSVFTIFISKLTGQEDIIIGTPAAGRSHVDLEQTIGMFVNTLAMRNEVQGSSTLKEYIGKLKQNTLESFEHQDYQFEDLVEQVSAERDTSHNPIFDVMFNMLNQEDYEGDLSTFNNNELIHTLGISKFDLTLTAVDYGEQMMLSFEYCTKLFKAETIERYIRYFKQIVNQSTLNSEIAISAIEIISAEEKQQLLYDFNDIKIDYPKGKTIYELFEDQVEKSPDSIALVYDDKNLTFDELNKYSNYYALNLLDQGVKGGEIIGIIQERSLNMIIGILAILKAGSAYCPINPDTPQKRIQFILKECNINILVSDLEFVNKDAELSKLDCINLNSDSIPTIQSGIEQELQSRRSKDITSAYIIFTSGSTGNPKGVIINHSNVFPLLYWGLNSLHLDKGDKVIQNLAFYFDWSVWEIFISLTSGSSLELVSKETILDDEKYVNLINKKSITVLHITPTQFQSLTHNNKKLNSMRHLCIGAEKLTWDLVKRSYETINRDCVVYNMYGPTEATIMAAVLTVRKDEEDTYKSLSSIPIGSPIAKGGFVILNQYMQIQPVNIAGELYISGEGLSIGYINDSEKTSNSFIKNIYESEGIKGEYLYKTGDLARWLPDGTVEFLGRIDHQVKIRGFRIELGEIENALLKHDQIKESVVIDIEENGEKYLCTYLIIKEGYSEEEIRSYLSASLPDYMIPSYFVELEKIPLNSNGKVNRKALPVPEIKAGDDYVAPSNATEEKLVDIWSEVLNVPKEEISVTKNFFAIGGHSLKATVLTGKIHKEMNVEFALRDVFLHLTIKDQANQIEVTTKKDFVSIPKAKKQEYYSLSSAQKRMYFLQQMDLESTVYNIPYYLPLGIEVNKQQVQETINFLIKRHESFRTSFHMKEDTAVQQIHEELSINIEEYKIKEDEKDELLERFTRAFDLSSAPLLRIALVEVQGSGLYLLIDMHHVISDGVSVEVLEQELSSLFSEKKLPELSLQYKDFSEWQNSEEQQEKNKEQETYWINKFGGELPVLNLPIDYVRPVMQSFEGAIVSFVLSKEDTEKIKILTKENGLTLYMSILSVFTIFLSKLTGQEDIIIGTPVAGRSHVDLEHTIGMFVNTLAMRNEVQGSSTLKEYISEIKQNTLESFEHQDYQFEDLVEQVSVKRDTSRNPIFDIMFNMLNKGDYEGDLSTFNNNELIHNSGISKFDLSLDAVDYGNQIMFYFEYCTNLFKPETIERYIGFFQQVLNQILINPEIAISEIEIISEAEKQELLYEFNDTKLDYPKDKTIQQLFEEQVERTPNNIALRFNDQSISYKKLDLVSNQLANLLLEKGVRNEELVGIFIERGFNIIISILGILKANCAYLPLDIEYPKERINYMLGNSDTRYVLTDESSIDKQNFNENIHCLDIDGLTDKSQIKPVISYNSNNLLYIIYTSGTTGKPKGVMIGHKNVVNLLFNKDIQFHFTEDDIWTMFHSHCFDFSVWEMYGAILNGGRLVLISKILAKDTSKYLDLLKKEKVSILNQTPSAFYTLIDKELEVDKSELSLRYVIFGGEMLHPFKLKEWKNKYPRVSLVNMFGITETTVHVTFKEITNVEIESGISNIGKAIPGLTTYVMEGSMNLQPKGIPGELYVGGIGVSSGYLKNSELTKDKFKDNPYNPGEKLYRTGDLVKCLPNNEIEYLGRIDDQVQLRGFRIELGEIENVLLKHENIKESVVLAREENSDKYLCAYLVTSEGINHEELRTFLSASLPDYMIPSYYVELDKMPLTTNGKVNRKILPSPVIKAGDDYVAPSNATEEKLLAIWSDVLNIPKEEISVQANFFSIGGHSLKATVLTGKIHKVMNVEFALRDVFLHSTIKDQANQIGVTTKKDFVSIPKAKKQEYYSLSSVQKRLYFLQQMDLESKVYNMPYYLPLGIEINKQQVQETINLLIKRHESFRTSFYMKEDTPVQQIHEELSINIEEYKIKEDEKDELLEKFTRVFDLSNAPLLRIALVEVQDSGLYLLIDTHHIISDGISTEVLEQELISLFSEKKLPELSLQYKDFSEWQNSEEQQEKNKKQEAYWINKFEEELPVLDLPIDYVRPVMQSFEGANVSFVLSKEDTEKIKILTKENGLTLYMSILSIFTILLSKLTGQEDIIVGTPVAGRSHVDLEHIIGMFVNTLAIRNEVQGNETLKEYLGKLKQNTLESFEYQDYQFEDLVDKVSAERDTSRNPIFDVMFNMSNQGDYEGDLSTFNNNEFIHNSGISKFDLTLTAVDYGDQLMFYFEYCTKLFKAETINRFIVYFKQLVGQLTRKFEIKISEIDILTEEEKHQLLYVFNNTEEDYPKDKTICRLFEEQVEKNPDNIALISDGKEMSYTELNTKANQLAHLIMAKGIKPGSIVGIMQHTSFELIIGIIGILKSGGAYLPIDPMIPQSRKQLILDNSQSDLFLCSSTDEFQPEIKEIIYLDSDSTYQGILENPQHLTDSSCPCYVIYTSGSTGVPKGVVIEHRSVVNFIYSMYKDFNGAFSAIDNCLSLTRFAFDVSVAEYFLPLSFGSKVVLYDYRQVTDIEFLANVIIENEITFTYIPPSLLNNVYEILRKHVDKVKLNKMLVGVEPITPETLEKYLSLNKEFRIINGYGPTEATICATRYLYDSGNTLNRIVPIGMGLRNNKIYLLDSSSNLVPIGVAGELCISGAGLSRGYLNNPEFTTEKFIPNPLKKDELLYRTGDLARWLADGNIEFIGRIDDQVKIRGFRIELGEIESALLKHESIRECVVIDREENGDKYLCAYLVKEEEIEQEEIRTYLLSSLPNYMIPSYFVELDKMPLTTNGKVNRKVLPSPEIKAGDDYVAPRNGTEEKLVSIWSEVLNIPEEEISITSNFFTLGGHSLNIMVLINKIHKAFNVRIEIREFYLKPILKELSSLITLDRKVIYSSIECSEKKEYYSMSSSQERMYVVQRMNPNNKIYDVPFHIHLDKNINNERVINALKRMCTRHEILRTGIHHVNNKPVQRVFDEVNLGIEIVKNKGEYVISEKFKDSFDLSIAPLCKFILVDAANEKILYINMHHIITDAHSIYLFIDEFNTLLSDKEPQLLRLQYKDFSNWYKKNTENGRIEKQREFWLNLFKDKIPILNLPCENLQINTTDGAIINFELNEKLTSGLYNLISGENITVYTFMLSVFKIFLSKISDSDDIVVGTPIVGRTHDDLQDIMGVFINTIVLRSFPLREKSFIKYLQELNQVCIEAYDNQEYQYDNLLDELVTLHKCENRNLFDALFSLKDLRGEKNSLNDQCCESNEMVNNEAKFDLSLFCESSENRISCAFEYKPSKFKKDTIDRFVDFLLEIIELIIKEKTILIKDVNITHKMKVLESRNNDVEFDL